MRFSLLPSLFVTHPHLFLLTHAIILNRTPPEPTSPPSNPLKNNPSCQLVGEALAICNSLTPSFQILPATSQASCLCYSSKIWAPDVFDSAVKYCADFASTAAAPAYPALHNLQGFCTDIGNVAINTQPVGTLSLATGGGGGYGGGPCGAMNEYT